ncbi:acyl carrier protein [Microlunatus sp. Gsoil 973]|uniref:acyl carrier protein n=1 Tax=Microlunatus sp. Gsoil 973 TaxID=2672569 RepID=UPI0018A829E2|nr:acyl carrier protein [Microlunatus sp. Gsoil 973]
MQTEPKQARELVLGLITEITRDVDTRPVTWDRRLGDLGLESISLVYLIAELQQQLSLGDRLVRELRIRSRVELPMITVGELADLAASLSQPTKARS